MPLRAGLGISTAFTTRGYTDNVVDLMIAKLKRWYWVRKLQARFFAGDYESAIEASSRAQKLLWISVSQFETAECDFYDALSRAACCDSVAAAERQQHLDIMTEHHKQLLLWAANCPENFENRAALVGAEIARFQGHDFDAMHRYERALDSAHAGGFIHHEGIANELAARFYATHGFEQIADHYMRNARDCYARWGADGKVRQLEELYPRLRQQERALSLTATIGARPLTAWISPRSSRCRNLYRVRLCWRSLFTFYITTIGFPAAGRALSWIHDKTQ